jgi:hypothetical protein
MPGQNHVTDVTQPECPSSAKTTVVISMKARGGKGGQTLSTTGPYRGHVFIYSLTVTSP